jgi:hypothetical protein
MADEIKWGPNNPHPLSRIKTELVWEGKYDEFGNRRPVSLPDFPLVMQKIETIDEVELRVQFSSRLQKVPVGLGLRSRTKTQP